MTKAEATAEMWAVSTEMLGFLGLIAVLLLALSLIGLVRTW